MSTSVIFVRSMIAPCGMNCGTCLAYLRPENKCCGCLTASVSKPKTRQFCKIKVCEHFQKTASEFCSDCDTFPCKSLKKLDKRYQTKYKISFIENLLKIKEIGLTDYLVFETNRWSCRGCGSTLSVHRNNCLTCNLQYK
jgi:hypothetical protein